MRYGSLDHPLFDSLRRRLWLKVITRAVDEAEGISLEQSNYRTRKHMIHDAKVWLTNSSHGLLTVCKLAEVRMEDVLEEYRGKYGVVK